MLISRYENVTRVLFRLFLLGATVSPIFAQNTFVNNVNVVPVPGVGHDYLHDLNEIVNPANGSLSVRIEAFRPKERGLNYPFYSYMYDSTQQFAVTYQETLGSSSYSCGPDTAGDGTDGQPPQPLNCIMAVTFPYQSIFYPSGVNGVLSGPNSMLSSTAEYSRYYSALYKTCNLYQGYSYEDPYGVIHDLGVYSMPQGDPNGNCAYLGISDSPLGGDEQYKIVVSDVKSDITFTGMIDTHGNSVQVFVLGPSGSLTMEDTNGNAISGTGRTGSYQSFQPWGDANARTASRTFAGGATYTYTWGTATTGFSPASVDETLIQLGYDNLCVAPKNYGGVGLTNPVVVKMQEPDGLYYTFSYDPTYGLLNKITYPTGAWVEYTWGVNSLSDATGYSTPAQFVNYYNDPVHLLPGGSMNTSCVFRHDTPAITKRVVSYDGVHAAQEQDFSYSTVWQSGNTGQFWNSKQTVVTTKDLLSSGTPSFQTIYNYSFWPAYYPIGNHLVSSGLAVENSIVYKDTAGNILRTVTKAWNTNNQLAGECTTLPNGKISGTFYQYESYPFPGGLAPAAAPSAYTTNLLTDVAEYDYGLVTTPCQKPAGTPTRETVTTYANFANTPLWPTFTYLNGNTQVPLSMPPMVDRPATVIKYQSGARISETDYGYDQTAVTSVSPTPLGHDETHYGNGSTAPRGNPTTVTQKCFQGSVNCTDAVTKIAYDTTGQAVTLTDPCGNATCSDMSGTNHTTTYSYADNYTSDDGSPSGNTNTYLTKITRPTANGVSQIESFQWDFNKGELRTATDANGYPTSYQYSDPWNRLTQIQFPDQGLIKHTYQDAGPNPSVTTSILINASGTTLNSTSVMDAAGHVIQTQLTSDPSGTDYVDTVYDGLGRVYSVSNPYRSKTESTYGVTTHGYDSLNRQIVQVQPDGGVLQWCYNDVNSAGQTNCAANASSLSNDTWVDFSDEAGNHWQRSFDALGRMTSVMEPNGSSSAPSMETDYSYNGLDDLNSVVQKGNGPSSSWRTRSFAYDSLSRLTSAANPESGTILYVYDANSNLNTKTAPAPNQTGSASVTTNYNYDVLNRVTSNGYSDGTTPANYYSYDVPPNWAPYVTNVVGRIANSSNQYGGTNSSQATATLYSYDPMGRITGKWEQTPSMSPGGKFIYSTFDLAGNLTSTTTAAGTVISYGPYNGANRLTTITSSLNDAQHPPTLYSLDPSLGYYANGAIRKASFGNGLTQTSAFNNRLQPCRINVNSGSGYYSTCTDSVPSGNVLDFTMGYNAGSSDNGNLASWSAVGNQTFSRTYAYDTLNRIKTMSDTASGQSCKGLSWSIDAWGNTTAQTNTGGTCYTFQVAAPGTNNQVTGNQYDAAGNVTYGPASQSFTYDAENRIIKVNSGSTASYVYNENGERIRKNTGSTWTEYFYGPNGSVQSEYNGSWPFQYVYAGNDLIAQYTSSTTEFVHKDHLGSTRFLTGVNQGIVDSMDYLPFGLQIAGGTTTTHKFTGKERDNESGLDNFGARYYESYIGRFMTPDPFIPFNLKRAKFQTWISNPQHWNKYAYALNNPLLYVDPSGMTETIYYFLNSSLTDEQKKYFAAHKNEILSAIADKLKEAGIKDVVFKEGSSLSTSQVQSILQNQPKGVALLNFTNTAYEGNNLGSSTYGAQFTPGNRAAVFVGNLQADNPSASELSFRIAEVSSHELGHDMGFYSRGATMSFIEFWNKDLMNEGQGIPSSSSSRNFDMSIPQNRQAVREINEQPEYNPQ